MTSFFEDNDDLRFYFDKGVDWDKLVKLTEHGFRAEGGFENAAEARKFYREVAELFGELAAKEIAPRATAIDREDTQLVASEAVEGPAMRAVFDALKAADVHRLTLPRETGGLNAPLLVYFLAGEMIARADVSTMTHFSFHGGMAMAMLAFSIHEGTTRFDGAANRISETRFADYIAEIARGDAWGSMDITEPNAGSDMAALRTRAEEDATGAWFISGQKIFITSGHGKYHFVIARTEEAQGDDLLAGLRGLSMFLVKAYEDLPDGSRKRWVTIDRVEEKLGHHGSVTASLHFDRTPAELVGKRGEGFQYMLNLMNNARIGVGFESIGLAECALRMAKDYAAERRSMGKAIGRHEMIADWLDEMETDIAGLRALAVMSGVHEEIAQKERLGERFGGELSGEARARRDADEAKHRRLARRYTPLLKYLAAEKAVEIARRNLQIHGGVGYTKDYAAEKLLRDALVLPVYEGTSRSIAHGDEGRARRHPEATARLRREDGARDDRSANGDGSARARRRRDSSRSAQRRAASPHRNGERKTARSRRRPDEQVGHGVHPPLGPEEGFRARHAPRRATDATPRRRGDRRNPPRSGARVSRAAGDRRALRRTRSPACARSPSRNHRERRPTPRESREHGRRRAAAEGRRRDERRPVTERSARSEPRLPRRVELTRSEEPRPHLKFRRA